MTSFACFAGEVRQGQASYWMGERRLSIECGAAGSILSQTEGCSMLGFFILQRDDLIEGSEACKRLQHDDERFVKHFWLFDHHHHRRCLRYCSRDVSHARVCGQSNLLARALDDFSRGMFAKPSRRLPESYHIGHSAVSTVDLCLLLPNIQPTVRRLGQYNH